MDRALWSDLRRLWKELARSLMTFWDNEEDEDTEGNVISIESRCARTLCMATAKFTRNLVAGVPENQVRA